MPNAQILHFPDYLPALNRAKGGETLDGIVQRNFDEIRNEIDTLLAKAIKPDLILVHPGELPEAGNFDCKNRPVVAAWRNLLQQALLVVYPANPAVRVVHSIEPQSTEGDWYQWQSFGVLTLVEHPGRHTDLAQLGVADVEHPSRLVNQSYELPSVVRRYAHLELIINRRAHVIHLESNAICRND